MSSRHQRFEEQLLGPKGSRLISAVFYAIKGYPLPPKATVIGVAEFPFNAAAIPPGHMTRSMRLDVLFVILSATERLTVGVEIKTDEGDLVFDNKLRYELVSDYSFLAVPSMLIPAALYVIRNQRPEDISKIGLVNLDNAEIVILPDTTTPKLHLLEVLIEAFHRDARRLEINSVSSPRVANYIRRGMFNINRDYQGMLTFRYRPQLPRPDKCYDRYRHSTLYQHLVRAPHPTRGASSAMLESHAP